MTKDPASPVCYATEADDSYMGYATRDEILAALGALIEAERAGARVTRHSHKAAPNAGLAELMLAIHADEARWCAMLHQQIRRLGGIPSQRCGAFYGKAMAIADPLERLAFLNRGQAWVVRALDQLLPRVRDDALHAALHEMRTSHIENIARAARFPAP
jgi:hypothetical protein